MDSAAIDREWLPPLAWALAGVSAANVVAVAWLEARARVAIGSIVARRTRHASWRVAGLIALVGATALVLFVPADLPRAPLALALIGAIVVRAIAPGNRDSWIGERGARVGWHARRFEELEEWRLIGDHLRWRLFGVWIASDCPKSDHAALRQVLERAAKDRESRFDA